ncbi:MAG: DNA repair and recombination protein RadB [Candidatus Thermoplasmatota archaeon]|nr:DNA repair and recombination protein RadB [Candidatus Thermoplasmatota archaeon]
MRIKTECLPLDDLLGGGIESGIMTEVYGEGGSGKTNLCLQLARNCARNSKVFYIDAEGVSIERFKQICGKEFEELSRNVLFYKVHSPEEQEKAVAEAIKLMRNGSAGLVVLDSAVMHYRLTGDENDSDNTKNLLLQLRKLMGNAMEKDVPVILTNQVYTDVASNTMRPICEFSVGNLSKAILSLGKLQNGIRTATIIKHRSRPEGAIARFRITENGLE